MEMEQVVQLISSVGFPIACCLVCFWYINKMTEQHKEEIAGLQESINNNTLVLEKLIAKLDA